MWVDRVHIQTRPPHWRAGVLVYPVASSENAPRPSERRSASRHTVTAIIYVHLGSDNGGIVINLGTGGVAFQAAMRLTAPKDSSLDVRLRGSGLDVQLVGEIVWLGASQKEAGIRFKDPSPKQQQDIANWIVRQMQPSARVSYGERPWQELPPPIPFQPQAPEQFGSHSIAAALGMSQADGPSRIDPDADPDDSLVSALLDADSELPGGKPPLEMGPALRERNTFAAPSAPHLPSLDTGSSAPTDPAEPERSLPEIPLSKMSPNKPHERDRIGDSARAARIDGTTPAVVKGLPLSAADMQGNGSPSKPEARKSEATKAEVTKPVAPQKAAAPVKLLKDAPAAERWIPPAVLAAWRTGPFHHRLLIAIAATAGLAFFAMVLILAATHVSGSLGPTAASPAPQQPAAQLPVVTPAAPTVTVNQSAAVPVQRPAPAPPAYVPRRSDEPQPSLLASLAKTLFGVDSDDSDAIIVTSPIDDGHARVQVWTSKTNGYYYCTDDSFYKSVQPGAFMSQGDALQSGYRSILGQFCN